MTPELKLSLNSDQIARLSSVYIDAGVKKDSWRIAELDIDGELLRARIEMKSCFVSPTDPAGFHLTIFSTQEFLAQLSNIYLHLLAGSESKDRETWMRESSIVTHSPIRSRDRIIVQMRFFNTRRLGQGVYAQAECRVSDESGGLFTAELKGMLS